MTRVLLVTSNGTGMGHLTRQAAVALSMRDDAKATIFSLSLGLPQVTSLGIPGEYCPSYDRPWIPLRDWNAYLSDRLVAVTEETGSEAILFDGVAPYPGLASAAREIRGVAFIWLRRGMWKDTNQRALAKGGFFDAVIEPGDLASEDDTGPTSGLSDAIRVAPISILEPLGMLPRVEARSQLGLPADGPVALVTLGSGMRGDVAGPGGVVVKTLLEKTTDWHIAVTKPAVARNEIAVDQTERLTQLSGVYPLATFLSAFDMAISSAGYNAVHELTPAGVPSLLVANTSTQTDDQVKRAQSLERQGLALAVVDSHLEGLEARVHEMLDDERREALGQRARDTKGMMTGASETGAMATGIARKFDYRRRTASELAQLGMDHGKDLVRRVLGDERTERLKSMLGRSPKPVHPKVKVTVVDTVGRSDADHVELTLVRSPSARDLRSDQPVEHLLAGSSQDYEMKRREIIDRYYDVVSG